MPCLFIFNNWSYNTIKWLNLYESSDCVWIIFYIENLMILITLPVQTYPVHLPVYQNKWHTPLLIWCHQDIKNSKNTRIIVLDIELDVRLYCILQTITPLSRLSNIFSIFFTTSCCFKIVSYLTIYQFYLISILFLWLITQYQFRQSFWWILCIASWT